jgi:hypothetical protein
MVWSFGFPAVRSNNYKLMARDICPALGLNAFKYKLLR